MLKHRSYCNIYCVEVDPAVVHERLEISATLGASKLEIFLLSELIVHVPREEVYQSPAGSGSGQPSVKIYLPRYYEQTDL